jgi:hypothetical protein
MTEADTFNALKRIPFKQMYAIWHTTPFGANWQNFYEQYGWTHYEFWDECDKREYD